MKQYLYWINTQHSGQWNRQCFLTIIVLYRCNNKGKF